MLYDPYGSSEDGVIILDSENNADDNVIVKEWGLSGLTLEQEGDMICLTSNQVEQLYQIIKHNR